MIEGGLGGKIGGEPGGVGGDEYGPAEGGLEEMRVPASSTARARNER